MNDVIAPLRKLWSAWVESAPRVLERAACLKDGLALLELAIVGPWQPGLPLAGKAVELAAVANALKDFLRKDVVRVLSRDPRDTAFLQGSLFLEVHPSHRLHLYPQCKNE